MSAQPPTRSARAPGRGTLGAFGPPLLLLGVMRGSPARSSEPRRTTSTSSRPHITPSSSSGGPNAPRVPRGSLDRAGVAARDPDGLLGILAAPFLHGGFGHLIANTVPLLVLGTLVALHGHSVFWRVTAVVVLLGGLGTWLIAAPNSVTIGASGLVFGYLSYLLVVGLRTGHWRDLLTGVVVLVLYGGLLAGALPWAVAEHISWQAHLCGAIAGGAAAWWWPPVRPAPRGW